MEQVVSSQTSNIVPEGFANLLPPQRIPDLAFSLLLRSEFRFTLHQNVQRTYSICHALLSRSVQRSFDRFVTEIAPKSWLLCQIRSPIGYGFRAGVRAISQSVNIASFVNIKTFSYPPQEAIKTMIRRSCIFRPTTSFLDLLSMTVETRIDSPGQYPPLSVQKVVLSEPETQQRNPTLRSSSF